MTTVTEYKSANQNIAQKCRMISENLLVKINTKRVYEELQFFDDQIEHKETVQNKLYGLYHDIMTIMKMQFAGKSVTEDSNQNHIFILRSLWATLVQW